MVTSRTAVTRFGTALAAPLMLAVAVAGPAEASPSSTPRVDRQPVVKATITCVGPSEAVEFGGALVELRLRGRTIPADDVYVVVPVDVSTRLDAGDRTTIGATQRRATAMVPADGRSLTPATSLEIRLGGDVVQRIAVPAGCGVVDPVPDAGPIIGAVTADAGTVSVQITNGSSISDEIGVSLFPVGGTVADSRFLTLAPGATGTVTFTGVLPGRYDVEAFGYSSFEAAEPWPLTVG